MSFVIIPKGYHGNAAVSTSGGGTPGRTPI